MATVNEVKSLSFMAQSLENMHLSVTLHFNPLTFSMYVHLNMYTKWFLIVSYWVFAGGVIVMSS